MFTQQPSISLFDTHGPMLPRLCGHVVKTDNGICVLTIDHAKVTGRVEIPLDALRTLLKEE